MIRVINKESIIKVFVIISFFCATTVNILSFILPVYNQNVGYISAYYPNYFTPADFTFIIWNVIYILMMGAFAFYQYKLSGDSLIGNESLSFIRISFIAYCIFKFIWLLSWRFYYLALSTVTLFVLTVYLGYICRVIYKIDLSVKDRLFIKIPFSILYGWISIKAVMNFTVLMESIRWKGLDLVHSIGVLMLFILVALFAVIQTYMNKDIAYCLTIIWSYIGILVQHIQNEANGSYPYAVPVLIICIVILTGSVIYLIIRKGIIHKYLY